jgi:hypothetical protein
MWTVTPFAVDRSDRVRLGPSGPGYCIAQTADGICCLDPLTGSVRWQRRDVRADAGLFAHEEAGIFGDERQLVVLEADQRTCRVLTTDTGELLSTTVLPTTDLRRSRLVFGARLLLVAEEHDRCVIRLWDAATQSVVYEEPVHLPVRHYRVDRRHAAFVAATGEVVLLDTRAPRVVQRHPLDPPLLASLTGVTAWHDRDQWYVHTSHSGLPAGGGRTDSVTSDVQLPSVTLNGMLTVYDRQSGSQLWSRACDGRTLLMDPARPFPCLVTLWRGREGLAAAPGGLTIEVLDKRSGRILAQASDIARTRFVHAAFDPASGHYDLYGADATVSIRCHFEQLQPIVTAEK